MKSPESKSEDYLNSEPMTDEQFEALAEAMRNPEAAMAALPEEEQRKYREAQESVVEARRAGERIAHTLWVY